LKLVFGLFHIIYTLLKMSSILKTPIAQLPTFWVRVP
jgi:hypothetical protein